MRGTVAVLEAHSPRLRTDIKLALVGLIVVEADKVGSTLKPRSEDMECEQETWTWTALRPERRAAYPKQFAEA